VVNLLEDWSPTEAALLREAPSFDALVTPLKGRLSPLLIGDDRWEDLWRRVQGFPVTIAAFPFGFELPLHDPRPIADFGISILGASRSEQFFLDRVRSGDRDPTARAIASIMDQTRPEDSALGRVAGRKLLLEYDIPFDASEAPPDPGIFMYPVNQVLVGGRPNELLGDLAAMVDGVVAAAGWDGDPAERGQVERLYRATDSSVGVRAVGVFPSRARALRLAVTGFAKAAEAMAFLERVGWPGPREAVALVAARVAERAGVGNLGVHLDVRRDGLGPNLGCSFYAREGEWVKGFGPWKSLVDALAEEGLGVSEKLVALAATSCGAEALFGKSGVYILLRGIHHLKLGFDEEGRVQVKAYLFWLLRCARRTKESPGG